MATPFSAPKRGKARTLKKHARIRYKNILKNPASRGPKYVRHGTPSHKARHERCHTTRSLQDIDRATDDEIIAMSLQDGVLQDIRGTQCPHCNHGVLGRLRKHKGRHNKEYRCTYYKCLKNSLPHTAHLVFKTGDGRSFMSLRQQTAILFAVVHNAPLVLVHHLTRKSNNVIEHISRSNNGCRRMDVIAREKIWRDAPGQKSII